MMIQNSYNQRPITPDLLGDHSKRLKFIAVIATLGGLLFGYDTGVINGALEPMKADLGLDSFKQGLVVSILIFGAAIGALVAGKLADRFGRKRNISLLAIIFIVSTAGCALAPSWKFLVFARFILGFAVGGASVTVPIYLAEIFLLKIRSFAVGICVLVLWLTNACVAFFFPPMVEMFGISNSFFVFFGLGLIAIWFTFKMVPETRGKTLEEFEEEFKSKHSTID